MVGQVTPVTTSRTVVAAMPPITLHTNGLWPLFVQPGMEVVRDEDRREAGGLGELRLVDERTGPVVLAGEEVAEGRHDGRAGRSRGRRRARSGASGLSTQPPRFSRGPAARWWCDPARASSNIRAFRSARTRTGLTHRIQAVTVDDDDANPVGDHPITGRHRRAPDIDRSAHLTAGHLLRSWQRENPPTRPGTGGPRCPRRLGHRRR